jgi:hypothetical protein
LFSEILNKKIWLKLMDFLFTNFEKIEYFLLVPIAILKELKNVILTIDNNEQIINFFKNQQDIHFKNLKKNIIEMFKNTDKKHFIAIKFNLNSSNKDIINNNIINNTNVYNNYNDVEQCKINLLLTNGQPMFPITKSFFFFFY